PAVLLRLDPRKLAAASFHGAVDVLPCDGEGMSSLLADLYLQHPDRLQEIVRQLQAVVPSVRNITLRHSKMQPDRIGYELLIDMQGADRVSASALSEGTLLTLG